MLEESLQNLVKQKREENVPDFLILVFLKEYLQFPVLDFLYKNDDYREFIFTGGSCLRICHGLPRLSEDLDFDLPEKDYRKLDWEKMEKDLKEHFEAEYSQKIETKVQTGKRIYLKFPILKKLDLFHGGGSDFLYVKLEPSKRQFKSGETEIMGISDFGFNFLVKKYSLKHLMTGKIIAILTREWFQGRENEIDIKGRDFYDLFWYFQNNVEPDYKILSKELGIKTFEELKVKLGERIEKDVTPQKLRHDILRFFPDQKFAEDLCRNYKVIMNKYL